MSGEFEDFLVNVSIETLHQNKIFRVIKKTLVKKCLEMTRGSFVRSGAGRALMSADMFEKSSANGCKRQQHTQGARQAAQKRESEVREWEEVERQKKEKRKG